jgi:hypothetical protein
MPAFGAEGTQQPSSTRMLLLFCLALRPSQAAPCLLLWPKAASQRNCTPAGLLKEGESRGELGAKGEAAE